MLSQYEREQIEYLLESIEADPRQDISHSFVKDLLGPVRYAKFKLDGYTIQQDQLDRQKRHDGTANWPPAVNAYYDTQYREIDTYRGGCNQVGKWAKKSLDHPGVAKGEAQKQRVHDLLWSMYNNLSDEDRRWLSNRKPDHGFPLPPLVCYIENAKLDAVFPNEASATCQALKPLLIEMLED